MSVLENSTATIRDLNDAFRKNFACGKVVMTSSLACEPDEKRMAVLQAVKDFDTFTEDNDPHKEHDWGTFQLFDETWNWKIDYYDLKLECGSEDSADTTKTIRVLSIGPSSDF